MDIETKLHDLFSEAQAIINFGDMMQDRINAFRRLGGRFNYSQFGLTQQQANELLDTGQITMIDPTGREATFYLY